MGKVLKHFERRWTSLPVFVLDRRAPVDNGLGAYATSHTRRAERDR
jgi:hypothetical protein